MIETFSENSPFLQLDERKKRWAVPYHYEALNCRIENIIIGNLEKIKNRDILDIGSHYGTFAYSTLLYGAKKVIGIDDEKSLITRANELFQKENIEKSRYDFFVDDGVNFLKKQKDNSFDTILSLGILYYINDPISFLKEMHRVTRDCVIIDTFTVYYAAVVSKDGVEIANVVPDEVFNTAIVFHPMTQAKKKGYTLKSSFKTGKNKKEMSVLSLPTIRALEQFFSLAGFTFEKISWDKYKKRDYYWREFIDQDFKRTSHWSDVYHTKIRVTYKLYKENNG